jgi:2-polyprenyl-3-methyl-5-hydroxy-6-metoxy-1,4-benzoquinol methylase
MGACAFERNSALAKKSRPMTTKPQINWANLDFAGFAKLASDARLSKYEKIGFPDSYRKGFEPAIFADIRTKLPRLSERGLTVLDIGPGCSDLPAMLIELCAAQGHQLNLVDSPEMLTHLPDMPFTHKRPGRFPDDGNRLADLQGQVDVIICYSVLHYIFVDTNVFDFIDAVVELLAPGGEALIGDIPNLSKRRRFFSTPAGVAYHRAFTGTDTLPEVRYDVPMKRLLDDAVVMALLMRARAAGADAYVLPQPATLPMANRREDILIRKP